MTTAVATPTAAPVAAPTAWHAGMPAHYDGHLWTVRWTFRAYGELALHLRTGKRPPVTVPARLCEAVAG
jgi:hypothetical protein